MKVKPEPTPLERQMAEALKEARRQINQLADAGVEKLREIKPEMGWDDGSRTAAMYIRDSGIDEALAAFNNTYPVTEE